MVSVEYTKFAQCH